MRLAAAPFVFFSLSTIAFGAFIHVPDDFPTIQDAIDAAADGDTVVVRPGTYHENIDFVGKAIVVESEQGPDVTVIEGCSGEDSDHTMVVVFFQSGEGRKSMLRGFTVTGGWGGIDGRGKASPGISCRNASSPTITGNIVTGNSGGGISCGPYSSPLIEGNTIYGNEADTGGGIHASAGTIIRNNDIFGNLASFEGGGIYGGGTIEGNTVSGNGTLCMQGGGGISRGGVVSGNVIKNNYSWYGGGLLDCDTVTNNTISGNKAYGSGVNVSGGAGIYGGRIIAGNLVTGNVSYESSPDCDGGGGICRGETVTGNTITFNSARRGGGVFCCTDLSGNIVSENSAGYGAGIYGGATITSNIVTANRASRRGGGIYGGKTLSDNIFSGNSANFGGGVYCIDSSQIIVNDTIVLNSAGNGGGIFCDTANNASPAVTNTIVWNNTGTYGPQIRGGDPRVSYCDVEGGWPGLGNIDADPLFADPLGGDYHLTWDSPCRDNGDAAAPGLPAEDFEGDPRVSLGGVDMGADEFHAHLYRTGTPTPGGEIELKVAGTPGVSPVTLFMGTGIQNPPYNTQYGAFWIEWPPAWYGPIGGIPGSGILAFPITVPPAWLPGEEHPFQALVGPWGGANTVLTNLMVLKVE